MKTWIINHKIITSVLVVATIGVIVFATSSDNGSITDAETMAVETQSVRQIISETGIVEADNDAELSFSTSGRVGEILVTEGDMATSGTVLARLDNESQQASLQQAEANLARERALLSRQQNVDDTNVSAALTKVESAEENLQQVRQTQDELVRSAREDLYTSNLEPYLTDGGNDNESYDFSPPTITGTFQADESAEYRLELYPSDSDSGWSFWVSGYESGSGKVSTSQPQPLGDSGLFIEFPSDFARSRSIEWVLEIPNTRSSNYATLKNTLEKAEDTRESAISTAENNLADAQAALEQARSQAELYSDGQPSLEITSQQAAVNSAQAQVRQAQSALADTILEAPFSGTVANISMNVGESITANQSVMNLVSDDLFEVSVDVPEVDTAQINLGDPVEITLDAFENETFFGEVVAISPTAETVNGVQIIEVTVSFTDPASYIKPGLSADVEIYAAEAIDVMAIPARAVIETDDDTYVRVVSGDPSNINLDDIERRSVTTGLRGSDGYIEITNGLEPGDVVVTFLPEASRDALSEREDDNQ